MNFILVPRYVLFLLIALIGFSACALSQQRDPEQLFRAALAAQERGDFAEAIHKYQDLLELDPKSLPALANLGAALAHVGRFDDAVAEYRSALVIDPANQAIRMNLALAFYKNANCEAAANELEEIYRSQPQNLRAATLLGDCELRLGHPDDAVRVSLPLAQSHPDDLDLAFVAGSALIGIGKRRDGATLIDRVAKQGHAADAYVLAGKTWLDLNEFESARRDLEQAVKLDPNLAGVHTLLGVACDNSGDPKAAEPEFLRALQINPDDFQANLYLGAILYKRRELPSARTYLEHALKINASSGMARYEMGMVESASGQLDAAAADLEAASKQDPNWLEPHVQLAALYYKMHRASDGAKQREVVDRLTAAQQKSRPQ